jgi:NADP-dependent 3-hydroxy acid dehydrogenase YdfG
MIFSLPFYTIGKNAGLGKYSAGSDYRPRRRLRYITPALEARNRDERENNLKIWMGESSMSAIKGKVIAITGASSGIGEAAARLLAQKGAHVVLGARRTDRLEALVSTIRAEGGSARYRALDVTKREDVEAFVNFAQSEFGKVDVIINNAGVMPLSPLEALKVNEWNQMIDVNIRGVLHGIAAGLPVMKKQGYGQFVNVSSIGGHAVYPTSAVYSATKFAVIAISEGLRQENDNIRVTVISPGVTESELADTISDPATAEGMREFRRIAIGADAIARAIAFAVEQPADVDVSEIIMRPTASPF